MANNKYANLSREEVWAIGRNNPEEKAEAFMYLLADCGRLIYKVMSQYGVTPATVSHDVYEDYLSEIKTKFYERYDYFDETKSSFATWFFTLVRGVVTNTIEASKMYSYGITSEMSRMVASLDKQFGGCDYPEWVENVRRMTNISVREQDRLIDARWNKCLTSLQEQNADGDFVYENIPQSQYPTPEETIIGKTDKESVLLLEAVNNAGLSEREKSAFLLHIGEAKTFAEIAEMFGVTAAAIQQAEARAIKRVKAYVAAQGYRVA